MPPPRPATPSHDPRSSWWPVGASDWHVPVLLTLALGLGPPIVAAVLTWASGPFHAGYAFVAWPAAGVTGLLAGLIAGRMLDDELGFGWAAIGFVVVLAGWMSAPWVVGAMGGWVK